MQQWEESMGRARLETGRGLGQSRFTEHYLCLDIRHLKPHQWRNEGSTLILEWKQADRVHNAIMVEILASHVLLHYFRCAVPRPEQFVEQSITITHTSCTYGGQRPWFL